MTAWWKEIQLLYADPTDYIALRKRIEAEQPQVDTYRVSDVYIEDDILITMTEPAAFMTALPRPIHLPSIAQLLFRAKTAPPSEFGHIHAKLEEARTKLAEVEQLLLDRERNEARKNRIGRRHHHW